MPITRCIILGLLCLMFPCAFAFAAPPSAPPIPVSEKDALAVLELRGGTNIDESLLPTLTEVLTAEIQALGKHRVVSSADIDAMLGFEQQRELLGCDEATCLAEIGGALGVERIVGSQIGKVGATYVVNMKLINIRTTKTESRVYDTVRGEVDVLISTLQTAVAKLFRLPRVGHQARVVNARTAPTKPTSTASRQRTRQGPAHVAKPQASTLATPTTPRPNRATPAMDQPTKAPATSVQLAAPSYRATPFPGWAPWATFGAGVAQLGAATALFLTAKQDAKCASDPTCTGGQLRAAQAKRRTTLSHVFFATGGVAAVGGLAWALTDFILEQRFQAAQRNHRTRAELHSKPHQTGAQLTHASRPPTARLHPWLGPQHLGLAYTMSF